MKDESQQDTLIETIYTNVRNRKKKFSAYLIAEIQSNQ